MSTPTPTTETNAASKEPTAGEDKCVICHDNAASVQFPICRHECCCAECGNKLRVAADPCPLCRTPLEDDVTRALRIKSHIASRAAGAYESHRIMWNSLTAALIGVAADAERRRHHFKKHIAGVFATDALMNRAAVAQSVAQLKSTLAELTEHADKLRRAATATAALLERAQAPPGEVDVVNVDANDMKRMAEEMTEHGII